jgi:hypothetical protein
MKTFSKTPPHPLDLLECNSHPFFLNFSGDVGFDQVRLVELAAIIVISIALHWLFNNFEL